MEKRTDRRLYLIVLVCSVLFLVGGNWLTTWQNDYFAGRAKGETYYRAKVVAVTGSEHVVNQFDGWSQEYDQVELQVKLLEGAMKGETVPLTYQLQEKGLGYKVYPYEVGERIFVTFEFDQNGDVIWSASDHVREGWMLALTVAFLALLVVFGRWKGVNTVISLVFTTCAIFFVMIPGIIKGYNIYLITVIVAAFIIVMTLGVVIGLSSKAVSAAVGCICGVGLAGVLTVWMQAAMRLSGLVDEDSSFVMYINPSHPIDLRGVIFAAIVIGALGATMDVGISIASSLDELLIHRPDLTNRELFASGMNIGRDMMGTMSNTLVLAYVGSSLHLILLMLAYNQSMGAILNRERIAVEVLQTLAGSLGILFTVPATTLVTTLVRRWFGREWRPLTEEDLHHESPSAAEPVELLSTAVEESVENLSAPEQLKESPVLEPPVEEAPFYGGVKPMRPEDTAPEDL